jgi:uncharacterized membrane protein
MTNRQILIKTVGWRLVATGITFGTAWAITGSLAIGTTVGAIDGIVKFVGYFFYEKAWNEGTDNNT